MVSSISDTESVSSALEEEDKRINEEDVTQETEMISNVDHASLHVERGSLSSEDVDIMWKMNRLKRVIYSMTGLKLH
ncbi:hypothetical protein NC652_031219 [Populus alba x Populus x berolinensis]|nr:hypothetical protein NC652_031219 [Populus alba x Populus x berolinensis]